MLRKLLPAIALGAMFAPGILFAQGSSGTFGSRSLGGTLGGSQSSAFGGSGLSSSGSFGGGSSMGGNSGQGGLGATQNAGQVGSISGNQVSGRFVEGQRQAGQFVGGSSQTAQGFVGQQNSAAQGGGLGGGLGGQLGGANMLGGRGGQLGGMFGNQMNQRNLQQLGLQGGFGGAQNQRKQLRTSISLGFKSPAVVTTRAATQFNARLLKIPNLQVTGPLRVTMEGRTAVLTGEVGSEGDRDLAERLALLEPGISAVRNELVVKPAPEAEPIEAPAAQVTPPVND